MTPPAKQQQRYAAFRRWCRVRELTEAQGLALTNGLLRVGLYLQLDEHVGARLRLMGGDAGPATLCGFMVLHGEDW